MIYQKFSPCSYNVSTSVLEPSLELRVVHSQGEDFPTDIQGDSSSNQITVLPQQLHSSTSSENSQPHKKVTFSPSNAEIVTPQRCRLLSNKTTPKYSPLTPEDIHSLLTSPFSSSKPSAAVDKL